MLRWLEGQTEVILDSIQGGKRELVHNELTKIPFLKFLDKLYKKEIDLRLGRLKKSRGDGDVDFSEPSIVLLLRRRYESIVAE